MKTCSKCERAKELTEFYRSGKSKGPTHRAECKSCSSPYRKDYYEEHKEQFKASRRLRNYGLSEAAFDDLLTGQEGKCAICNKYSTLVVDHDHKFGHVRGLLCRKCNQGLGLFGENADTLEAASKYLRLRGSPNEETS